jgi:hypothetical protein
VRLRRRRETAATASLADELSDLEKRARQQQKDYRRETLAEKSGVSRDTVDAWLGGLRTPRSNTELMKVVDVLSTLAGEGTPEPEKWQELRASTRRKPTRAKRKHRGELTIAGIAAAAVLAVVTSFFGLAGQDLFGLFHGLGSAMSGSRPSPSTGGPSPSAGGPPESLEANAAWCCTFAQVTARSGFYWSGPVSSFGAALTSAGTAGLTPAGVGIIEIPLQSSTDSPIYVAAPQVVVRSRDPNVTHGLIAILPRGGQGTGSTSQFDVDIDAASPVVVPAGSQSAGPAPQSVYYYVSGGSPEVMILTVRDTSFDCSFDLRITWQAQGRVQSQLLTNGGTHFHILGSSGLPWYQGDPREGVDLVPVAGTRFPV